MASKDRAIASSESRKSGIECMATLGVAHTGLSARARTMHRKITVEIDAPQLLLSSLNTLVALTAANIMQAIDSLLATLQ